MHKKQHKQSGTASRTDGITLDHAAGVYDVLAPIMTLGLERRFHREVIGMLDLQGGEHILDIGCGTGTMTRDIAAALADKEQSMCVGLDAAERMIEVAEKKALGIPNIRFCAALAEELPFESQSMDAVVSAFFFHHIHYRLKVAVLKEIRRVLKAGGRAVVFDVDSPTSWFGRLCAESGHWIFQQNEIGENINGLLRTAFDECGMSWQQVSHHSGYISVFELRKEAK